MPTKQKKQYIQLTMDDVETLKTGGTVPVKVGRSARLLTTCDAVEHEIEDMKKRHEEQLAGLEAKRVANA